MKLRCQIISGPKELWNVMMSTFISWFNLFPDNDFWYPMNSFASGSVPPLARGHSATYDPDSKAVYVYGGVREGQRYSELFILNTLTWKWKLVTVSLLQVKEVEVLHCKCEYSFCGFPPRLRLKGTFLHWRITQLPFIRRSFLCLAEFSRDIHPEINPAAMLCTSSTQSLNSGISPLWRGTNLCPGLGQWYITKLHELLL